MKAIPCADMVGVLPDGRIIIIERLNEPLGLALPGGKQDPGEHLSTTAIREFEEETGLTFEIRYVLGIYADVNRDPRGHYASTAFVGEVHGEVREEEGFTKVFIMDENEIRSRKDEFVNDHFQILLDYFDLQEK